MNFEEEAKHIDKHVKAYTFVLATLLVLTVVTVLASFITGLTVTAGIALALFIATIKGTLVASIFMHLKGEKRLVFYILTLTLAFFIGLILLPVFTESTAVQHHEIVAPLNEARDVTLIQKAKEKQEAHDGEEAHGEEEGDNEEEAHGEEEAHDDATVH